MVDSGSHVGLIDCLNCHACSFHLSQTYVIIIYKEDEIVQSCWNRQTLYIFNPTGHCPTRMWMFPKVSSQSTTVLLEQYMFCSVQFTLHINFKGMWLWCLKLFVLEIEAPLISLHALYFHHYPLHTSWWPYWLGPLPEGDNLLGIRTI